MLGKANLLKRLILVFFLAGFSAQVAQAAPEATLIYLMNGRTVTQVEAGNNVFIIATDLGGIVWADNPSIEITGTGAHSFPATSMTRYSSVVFGEIYYYSWIINDDAVGIQTFTLTHQGTDTVETTSNTITVIGTAPVTTPTINTLTSNDTTPVITGTTGTGNSLLTGETLSITLNGETYTPTVATDGTWSFTANTLADGTYDITATVTDTAGNVSTDTTSNELIIDTTAPATPTVNTLTSNDTTPEITGTTGTGNSLLTGETLSVALNGETYTPTVATDGTWSFTANTPLADGTYNVIATATDTAGNVSTDTTSNELTIDTTAPTATFIYYKHINGTAVVVTQVKQGDNMIVDVTFNEDIARDPPMQITGTGANTIATSRMIQDSYRHTYYLWEVGSGDGTQTFTLSGGTDLAGNVMASTSTAITVDNTAPVTPTVNTLTSNDPTPQITGTIGTGSTLLTGETLSVALNGETYTPTVATDGTWSFTVNTLADDTYDITATVTDTAGNVSTDTTSNELTVDTTAPATPTVNTLTSNDTTPEITGTIGTSTALSLSETFSVALDGTSYTPTVATDGTWSFTAK